MMAISPLVVFSPVEGAKAADAFPNPNPAAILGEIEINVEVMVFFHEQLPGQIQS